MTTHTPDLLTAALDAAARGWHVFPLIGGTKRPALHGADNCPGSGACVDGHHGWEQRATTDVERIRAAWTTRAFNVGLATGPSGLVVIDLDTPKPGGTGTPHGFDTLTDLCAEHDQPIPLDTFTVTTPSGGMHLYFTHPDGPELRNTSGPTGGLGVRIDTRAHGGYVVASGSRTPTGRYETTRDIPPAPLPGWLAEALTPAPLPPQQPVRLDLATGRLNAYVQAAITRQLAEITNAGEGGRNRALYLSAVALGQLVAGGAVAEDLIRELLARTAHHAGLGGREAERSINSGLRAGARRPRTVAA